MAFTFSNDLGKSFSTSTYLEFVGRTFEDLVVILAFDLGCFSDLDCSSKVTDFVARTAVY